MISKSRTIDLISKLNPDVFQVINKDVLGINPIPIGSNVGAVRTMLNTHEDMLKSLMPAIITTSINDPKWYDRVKNYWDSFSLKVPVGGVKFEIGFNFDFTSSKHSAEITKLVKNASASKITINTEEDFVKYVLASVPEKDKYRYATPINIPDYLTWTYLLGHRKIANTAVDVNNSTKIDYVFIDPLVVEEHRRSQHKLSIEATSKYLEILKDRSLVKDILYIKGENAGKLDDLDADAKLKQFVDSSPKDFLAIVNDKSLSTKARIERYCVVGILRKLPSSSIIVDALDSSVIIGNTLEEAVVFFNSEAIDKVAKANEFTARYNQFNKN